MRTYIALLFFLICPVLAKAAQPPAPHYAVAVIPTPVLNTPDFAAVFGGPDHGSLRLDPCGLIREMEFVALPGTVFRIERSMSPTIYQVTSDDYPYPTTRGYFIDSRFVELTDAPPTPRAKHLPPRQTVIANLLAAVGSRYVWGGNIRAGIPQLLLFYPPAPGINLAPAMAGLWQLRGVDCSGLLYEATGGFTPRNTSALVDYGRGVPIAGLDADGISRRVKPLDLLAWSGHVMIVLDHERLIESRLDCRGTEGGVRVRPLRAALLELLKVRVPLDDYKTATEKNVKGFVVRRWYPLALF